LTPWSASYIYVLFDLIKLTSLPGSFGAIVLDMELIKDMVHEDIRQLDEVVVSNQIEHVVSRCTELGKSGELP